MECKVNLTGEKEPKEAGTVYYAKCDIRSYSSKKIYAPIGAEITVVNKTCPTTWQCEYNGNQFFCAPDKLGVEMVKIETVIKVKRK